MIKPGSSILLHGVPKIGKTTFCASLPKKILYFDTEAGTKYIDQEGIKVINLGGPDAWEKFKSLVEKNSGFDKYASSVIDTVGNLYDSCLLYVCKKEGMSHPSDQAHGKGWNKVSVEFRMVLKAFLSLAYDARHITVLVAHTKIEEIDLGTIKYSRFATTLSGQAGGIVEPLVDTIAHLGYTSGSGKLPKVVGAALKHQGATRTMFLGGSQNIEAGTRDKEIKRYVIEDIPEENCFDYVNQMLDKPETEDQDGQKENRPAKTGRKKSSSA
jgi:hypothetical protein